MRYLLTLLACLLPLVASAQTVTHGMTIPDTSGAPVPLMFPAAELATLQARYAASPSTYTGYISGFSNPTGCATTMQSGCEARMAYQAFLRKAGGSFSAANGGAVDTTGDAINALNTVACSYWWTGTAADTDPARYVGELVTLTFTWLYADMTAGERSTIMGCVNRAIADNASEAFGSGRSGEDISSNYNWGHTRNLIEWAIATYNISYTESGTNCSGGVFSGVYVSFDLCNKTQTQIAELFLDEGITTRLTNLTAFLTAEPGGVFMDGTYYGKYLDDYMTVPFWVMADLGLTVIDDTPWWREHAWQHLYSHTSPKGVYHTQTATTVVQCFAHGAIQDSGQCPSNTFEVSNWMTYAAVYWDATSLGDYLRYWLTSINPTRMGWVKLRDADLGLAGTNIEASALDTDHYAPGTGFLTQRNTWTDSSSPTVVLWQLGKAGGHHRTLDVGNWQAYACGTGTNDCRWLVRASHCYGSSSYRMPTTNGTSVDCAYGWGQNSTFVNHQNWGVNAVQPVPSRLHHATDFNYAAVDLRSFAGYTALTTGFVREMVYWRAQNVVLVFDRVGTSGTTTPKVQTMRCDEDPPAIASDTLTCTIGSFVAETTFLSGSVTGQSVSYNERNEITGGSPASASNDPQYRIEATVTGTATSYLVYATHLRASGSTALAATLSQGGGVITVTLTVGGQTAVVRFNEGLTSSGGDININSGGATAFRSTVDDVTTSTTAFEWAASGGDTTPPVTTITGPTSSATYATSTSTIATLSGTCTDDVSVQTVAWTNDRGGSGSGACVAGAFSFSSIALAEGANVLTVTSTDTSSNTHSDTLTVTYTVPVVATPVGIFFGGFRVQ